MKSLQLTLAIIVLIASFYQLFGGFDKAKYEKRIEKLTSKHFGDSVVCKPVELDDSYHYSLQSFHPSHTIHELIKGSEIVGYYSIRRAKGCKMGGCSLNKDIHGKDGASYEHFDYLTIFSTNGEIQQVSVLNYEPEYGYEICGKRWLKQFIGSDGSNLEYEETIDAISGATTSAFSITVDISTQSEIIQKYINEKLQITSSVK